MFRVHFRAKVPETQTNQNQMSNKDLSQAKKNGLVITYIYNQDINPMSVM